MITLSRFSDTDVAWLVEFLTRNDWPYHAGPADRDSVMRRVDSGHFDGPGRATFIVLDGQERVGLVRVVDLDDPTPTFDLRIARDRRGRGVGTVALRELAGWVFKSTGKDRIEGTTRQDNIAMRRTFLAAGFVKEAHYRRAWPTREGEPMDAVGYALLRVDWQTGQITAVDWHDNPE